MITLDQYYAGYPGHREITPAQQENCERLLIQVNALLAECVEAGWKPKINPKTGSMVSGTRNGGWRPSDCREGAPNSSHKLSSGVDVTDQDNSLDDMIDDAMLERHGLYREDPDYTDRWCHLTTRAPRSGRRTFEP